MSFILSWLTAPILNAITKPFLDAYKARLEASTSQGAQAAELAVKAIEAEIAARAEGTKLMIAEQGRWWTALPRPLFAAPFIALAWDQVFGWGFTQPVEGDVATWGGIVITAYFGGRTLEKIASTISKRFGK